MIKEEESKLNHSKAEYSITCWGDANFDADGEQFSIFVMIQFQYSIWDMWFCLFNFSNQCVVKQQERTTKSKWNIGN